MRILSEKILILLITEQKIKFETIFTVYIVLFPGYKLLIVMTALITVLHVRIIKKNMRLLCCVRLMVHIRQFKLYFGKV